MASEAYLKALKDIPKDIQNDVIGSIDIANEIHFVLKQKGKTPADLARMLDKSESEISKWLTGLHNFTYKTVRKIENVLDEELLVTNSSKIKIYEEQLAIASKELESLHKKIDEFKNKENPDFGFNELMRMSYSSCLIGNVNTQDMSGSPFWNFVLSDQRDSLKIKSETKSSLKLEKVNYQY